MAREEINTVQDLIKVLNDLGAMQSNLEFYDLNGNNYRVYCVYNADDADDIVCIDLEKC